MTIYLMFQIIMDLLVPHQYVIISKKNIFVISSVYFQRNNGVYY